MEELLPLVIGIIWLAITWYNKSQKKKRAKDSQPSNEKREPSILEQIFAGGSVPLSDPEPVYEEILDEELPESIHLNEKRKSPGSFLNAELSDYDFEGQSISEDMYETEFETGFDHAFNSENELVFDTLADTEDFDLRKAVIYAEILKAPYIDYK